MNFRRARKVTCPPRGLALHEKFIALELSASGLWAVLVVFALVEVLPPVRLWSVASPPWDNLGLGPKSEQEPRLCFIYSV